jgi:hypothetical protein
MRLEPVQNSCPILTKLKFGELVFRFSRNIHF